MLAPSANDDIGVSSQEIGNRESMYQLSGTLDPIVGVGGENEFE